MEVVHLEIKKELEYFEIDGAFGGNQDWFTNVVMHIGGCAAATACDCCIYFAKHMGMKELYPYDIGHLNKEGRDTAHSPTGRMNRCWHISIITIWRCRQSMTGKTGISAARIHGRQGSGPEAWKMPGQRSMR